VIPGQLGEPSTDPGTAYLEGRAAHTRRAKASFSHCFWGLASGTFAAVAVHFLHSRGPLDLGSPLAADFWGAGAAFGVDVVVTVAVSLATKPKPEHELRGLVWGLTETEDTSAEQDPAERVWWRRPAVLGTIALLMTALLYLVFVF
jgi:solute:Na+ symporter, SSS family